MSLRAVVVMDYQNVHLTAHDVFDPDGERHDALIHPVRFARTAIRRRNECQRAGYPEAVLREVITFRGLPHTDYSWEQHRRCMAQADHCRAAGPEVLLPDDR